MRWNHLYGQKLPSMVTSCWDGPPRPPSLLTRAGKAITYHYHHYHSLLSLTYVWYHRNSPRAFVSIIYKMTDAIAHRGPDDEGYAVIAQALEPRFFSGRASPPEVSRAFSTIESAYGIPGEIALGHRRFSIIDITPDGYAHNDALENS